MRSEVSMVVPVTAVDVPRQPAGRSRLLRATHLWFLGGEYDLDDAAAADDSRARLLASVATGWTIGSPHDRQQAPGPDPPVEQAFREPRSERHLYPESFLMDTLTVRLGGRADEIVVLGEASTGASNDLASATDLATRMIREWGLSPALGPISYGPEGPSRDNPFAGRPYAEATQRSIDTEVARLLRAAEATATRLLGDHRDALDRVIGLLLERETIDGADLSAAMGISSRRDGPQRIWAPRAAAMVTTPQPRPGIR
jgi:Peptidase family M41